MNQSLDISFGFHFPWIEWRSLQETWQWWYEINMSITVSVMESLFSFSYRKINGHGLISSSSEDIILFGVDPPWYDFDCYSRLISSRCVNCRCWGSWRTLHGKMVTFSNKCCNNIPRCLSSWWRWEQCPGSEVGHVPDPGIQHRQHTLVRVAASDTAQNRLLLMEVSLL